MSKDKGAQEKFILHWGEMGTRWGINRTVAQTHALIYVSERPLNAEDICDALGIERSNAINTLKELLGWGIIKVVHLKGDRRDHYESIKDVWELFRVVAIERRKREIDPTLVILNECLAEKPGDDESPVFRERLNNLLSFMESICAMHDAMNKLPTSALSRFTGSVETLVNLTGIGKSR